MDDVNNNDMNPPGEDVIRSPPLTEDDLIDSLFLACDVRSDGTVPVSSLIEYLKLTSSAISENDEDLQSLERLFNEDGEKINIKVYRTKMKQWIYSIRKRNELESDQEDGLEQSEDSSCLSKDLSLLNGSSMDSSVVGTFGTEFDPVDQQNTIADLQYQNRKLSDENTKLRQQLDVQEDIVNINNTEIEKLQKKIKNLQQVVDSRRDIIEENEELKVTVTKLQEKKTELSSKVTHLEKERGNFENECCDLKAKLNDIATQLESVTALKVTLNKELAECRHELAHAKELKGIQEVHLNERYLEVSSLKKQLQDMSTELKECIKEKEEVKVELLQSLHVSRQVPSESGAADDILPTAVGSFVCSTPMRPNQSLCMELKGLIGHEKCMPSPLCPKEYHKEYRLEPMPVFTEEDEDGNDDATNNQLTQDISRFTEKFRHKQSELLAEIDSYFRQEECGETSQSSLQEKLQSSLSRELAEMTEQMASLAIAKDNADKRISQLSESMKKKKEENAMLRRMQHDSRSMLVECDRDLQNLGDRRLLILKDNLEEEKILVKNLKKELEEKSKVIEMFEGLQLEIKAKNMEEEIAQLKSTNADLTEKCIKAEAQISCLQDDISKSEKDVEIEKLRSFELEENLYSCKLARQMDLKEIWRLVQTEADTNEQEDLPLEIDESSGDVKNRIFNEILELKSDVHLSGTRKENIVDKRDLPSCKCSCFGTGSTSSSPLVEALTIDHYNGNRPLPHPSSVESLDNRTSPNSLDITVNSEDMPLIVRETRGGANDKNCLDLLCNNCDPNPGSLLNKQNSQETFCDNSSVSSVVTVRTNRASSQGSISSLDCVVDGEIPSEFNETKENNEGGVSFKFSLSKVGQRRLSYQAAINEDFDETILPVQSQDNSTAKESEMQSTSPYNDTCTRQESEVKFHSDGFHRPSCISSMMGDDDVFLDDEMMKSMEGYCWNDNLVIFNDDISYSSHSFSHLSYPFQPLRRQDVTRPREEMEAALKLRNHSNGVDQVCEELTEEETCPPLEGSLSIEKSPMSVTTALAKDLEKLTICDTAERRLSAGDLSVKKMEPADMKLTQIRQNNLARRREQMKHIALMPDLKESRESFISAEDPTGSNGVKAPEDKGLTMKTTIDFDLNSEPSPETDKVFPSIPDSFLKKHDLTFKKDENITNSVQQLTDTEVENKFTNLSLAFKTDKLTLDKRLEIQERYRDLSEQNVDKEIMGLRSALETISHLPECADAQVQEVLQKIRKHVDVLSHASTKVSSRAEVYGAVQQEKRMSKAIEVMIAHVENLKMANETKQSELEDAKKMIQDGRPFGHAFESDSVLGKRSMSVCQGSGLGTKTMRRRTSETVGPRINGSLPHSLSLPQNLGEYNKKQDVLDTSRLRRDPREDEDAKSKFQNVISSTMMKNSVTSSLRTNSSDRLSLSSREPSTDGEKSMVKQNSKEEEAFQKGFEQGFKAQVGRDLSYLREQQNNVSQALENIMDEVDQDNEQEEKNLTDTIKDKFWDVVPTWEVASKKLRFTMAGFVFFMAICSIILSLFPYGQAAMQVQPQYSHMGQPPS